MKNKRRIPLPEEYAVSVILTAMGGCPQACMVIVNVQKIPESIQFRQGDSFI